jgi:hypothetical protein
MYNLISNLSIFFGSLATISICFNNLFLLALLLSLFGFIASVFAIFYETKYQIDRKLFSKSFIGLFLSSIPVLYIVFAIMVFKY